MQATIPSWYPWLAEHLQTRTGIVLAPERAYLAESRLQSVQRRSGDPDLESLIRRLRTTRDGELEQWVIDALTTNETSFFRDRHIFDVLATDKISELVARRGSDHTLRMWSAACSTGQEPYTLAIIANEHRELRDWKVSIQASDLCTEVLAQAEAGRYRNHEIRRGLTDQQGERYFRQDGRYWVAKPKIRDLVTFAQHNLLDSRTPGGDFDLVLLRNVLIYFDGPTQLRVIRNIHSAMAKGGLLILGGAEAATRLPPGHFDLVREERSTWLRKR